MKIYVAGIDYYDIWIDNSRSKVIGVFADIEAAKQAAEEAVKQHGHGRPFVHEYVMGEAAPDKWETRPDWTGQTIYYNSKNKEVQE